ncbi:MAG TPA: M15 family metallopeptidase [Bryobacteraceae bacterium]|nr:M15 family metallopeptidase [Bryobacteraceae bacterium]
MRTESSIRIAIFTFLAAAMLSNRPAAAASPSEILANADSLDGYKPQFHRGKIPPSFVDRMRTTTWHRGCPVDPKDLRMLTLSYWNYKGKPAAGKLIVNKKVSRQTLRLFEKLFQHGFMIEKMAPIEEYDGNDDASMAANNTSAFNCRDITLKPGVFSNHSWGRAIDINPLTNPYVKGDKVLPPAGREYLDRTRAARGSIAAGSYITTLFEKRGWTWGGRWTDRQDYQHFEKPVRHRHWWSLWL